MMRLVVCFAILLLTLGGCKRSTGSRSTLRLKPSPSRAGNDIAVPKFDACALLTKEELQTIQGSAVTDTKSSENADGVFRVSQCYYGAAESDRSVSLSVTQAKAGGKNSPRGYWNETFGRYREGEKENEPEKKEKEADRAGSTREREEKTPPTKIEAIGEEAFWSGNRFGGALYVLKKENMIRISVGGPDNPETKINKSKALAEKALNRV
jgi:hypothetical protein